MFPPDMDVLLDGVVRGLWRDAVVENDAAGRERINRKGFISQHRAAKKSSKNKFPIWRY